MNDDELKGKGENLKGRIKQAGGALTGNKKMEASGAMDRAKGAVKEKLGEVKRKLDNATSPDDTDKERDE